MEPQSDMPVELQVDVSVKAQADAPVDMPVESEKVLLKKKRNVTLYMNPVYDPQAAVEEPIIMSIVDKPSGKYNM